MPQRLGRGFEERTITAGISAAIAGCIVIAFLFRPASLPPEAAARWAEIARDQETGTALVGRSYIIDGVTASGTNQGSSNRVIRVRRGAKVTIHGWAFDPRTLQTARAFAYRTDGGAWRPGAYHIPRADVAAFFHFPDSADCGFRVDVETSALPAGRHDIALATVGENGAPTPLPQRIRLLVTV